jgi:hypothetical protein
VNGDGAPDLGTDFGFVRVETPFFARIVFNQKTILASGSLSLIDCDCDAAN